MIPATMGWRFAFGIGALLGLVILLVRHFIPESPRWLMTHGRHEEAERIVGEIEDTITQETGKPLPAPELRSLTIQVRDHTPWGEIWDAMFRQNFQRSMLGLTLMVAQAFFYNAIFFTYALLLIRFYHVPAGRVGWYLLPFSLGNLLGPIVLGHLFDSVGRKPMIALTYSISGILLAITGWLFMRGVLTATTQSIAWTVIFFIASCAASAAYLTVSEIFPLEIRGMAISLFYAIGTLVGGVGAPLLFGYLIGTGSRTAVFEGYAAGAALMVAAGIVEAFLGVKAEGQSLESISAPLTSIKR
jgi:MFS family permease